jgi:hypothetical protein
MSMELYLTPRQSRPGEPGPYETKLAGAIEEIFGGGVHDLSGLVSGLNERGLFGPDGAAWTEQTFTTEMQRLGA